jgi:hypothetical protein
LCYRALNAGEDTMWCARADDPSRCQDVGRTTDGECIVVDAPALAEAVGRLGPEAAQAIWYPLAKLALAGPKLLSRAHRCASSAAVSLVAEIGPHGAERLHR